MPSEKHEVQPGETLPSIAAHYGFRDWATVWEAPENASLRDIRNPHVLNPGDIVQVPERLKREESGATERHHRFRARRRKTYLVIRLLDPDREPYASTDYRLTIGPRVIEESTDGDGWIQVQIPRDATEARLSIGNESLLLRIGMLDPPDERTGYVARLINLGYLHTENPDDMTLATAVQNFQNDHGLAVDGIVGPKTIAELKKQHGG